MDADQTKRQEMFDQARQSIEDAASTGSTSLDWSKLGLLDRIPPEISRLTKLTQLSISKTQVSDLTPIGNLANLRDLNASSTAISDLRPLSNLVNLQDLNLRGTRIRDLSPLASLPALNNLTLWNTAVEDFSPLAGLTSISTLDLDGTKIVDLSVLRHLTRLALLFLSETKVSDLSPISDLAALAYLILNDSAVVDIRPLQGMTSLRSLSANRTSISDLSPIAGLTKLDALYISETRVTNLSPLSALRQLTVLHVDRSSISSIEPLSRMHGLSALWLSGTRVSDLSPLSSLSTIKTFSADDTLVRDLAPLSNQATIELLNINRTPVADLSPLANLRSLAKAATEHSFQGLSFDDCPNLTDPTLKTLAKLPNPRRTIATLAYLNGEPHDDIPVEESPPNEPPPAESVEPQSRVSLVFSRDEASGRIDIDVMAGEQSLRADALQADLHDGVRQMVEAFLAMSGPGKPGNNQLAPWRELVVSFKEVIGARPSEVRVGLAILHGNSLRVALTVDDQRRANRDPDNEPMPEGAAGDLRRVVDSWNVYVGTDPYLDRIDSRRLGPDAVERRQVSTVATHEAVNAAEKFDIATPEAIRALREAETGVDQTATSAEERAFAFQLEALKNFSREALRLALTAIRTGGDAVISSIRTVVGTALKGADEITRPARQAAEQTGKDAVKITSLVAGAALPNLVIWITSNTAWLSSLFANNPSMRAIVEFFRTLL
jgi:hypothetical protein